MIIKKRFLIISQVISLLISLAFNLAYAQKGPTKSKTADEYFTKVLAELKLDEEVPQEYHVTSYWYNRDIAGNTAGSIRITGEFTRSLKDNQVHCLWNNVRMAGSQGSTNEFPEGKLLDYMENFSYTLSEEIMKEKFYKDFPDNSVRNLIKTLLWDAPTIELAYMSIDKLKYNEPYRSTEFKNKEIQMADFAAIKMRDLRLTWTGISNMNSEICALIQYRSFSNPVKSNADAMSVKGRSCYWGSFWVSLEDKQVEYATLNEDIIMEMVFPDNPAKRLLNIQREVVFNKMK